jgi:hypothetical protein
VIISGTPDTPDPRSAAGSAQRCESEWPREESNLRTQIRSRGGRASRLISAGLEPARDRDYRYFEKPAGVVTASVTASSTLTLREAAFEPNQRWRH